jgi:hypothetical protein
MGDSMNAQQRINCERLLEIAKSKVNEPSQNLDNYVCGTSYCLLGDYVHQVINDSEIIELEVFVEQCQLFHTKSEFEISVAGVVNWGSIFGSAGRGTIEKRIALIEQHLKVSQ